MVTCGTQYGVYIEGELTWFTDYRQAAQIEAEQLSRKVRRKRAARQTVILTPNMWRQVKKAQSGKMAA